MQHLLLYLPRSVRGPSPAPGLPAGAPARLCALCHRRKSRPAARLRTFLPLKAHAYCRSCTTSSPDTTPPDLDKTAQSISRSCQLHPRTHTHACMHRDTHTHTHPQQHSSHLFKTPNTFAHIFTDICFHQPKQCGSWRTDTSKRGKAKIREVSLLLRRSASAPRD